MSGDNVMQNADFWHEGNRLWLAVPCRESGEPSYEEAMLAGVSSDAFLPFQIRYQDDRKYYLYETTGKISLTAHMGRGLVDYAMMTRIIKSVIRACDLAEEYLLDVGSVLTDPDYIYVDLLGHQLSFVCFPGYAGDFFAGIGDLAACLLAGADHQDQDCVLLVYDFFRITREEGFGAAALKQFAKEEIQPVVFAGTGGVKETPEAIPLPYGEPPKAEKRSEEKAADEPEHPASFKRWIPAVCFAAVCTGILWAYLSGYLARLCSLAGLPADDRVVAVASMAAAGVLCYAVPCLLPRIMKKGAPRKEAEADDLVWYNDEPEDEYTQLIFDGAPVRFRRPDPADAPDLVIYTLPAMIGSAADADVRIDERGISRRHAIILREQDTVWIEDAGSTNGTYIGRKRLAPGEKVPLSEGEEVRLANVRLIYFP